MSTDAEPERWTQAAVYPDMWADPDADPRDTGADAPDGEAPTLQEYLSDYRLTLVMKCEGLTPEQLARRSVPPSTMSLLGLVRHLAEVERDWRTWLAIDSPLPRIYGPHDADFDGAVADLDVIEEAWASLAHEQAATDAAIAEHPDLGERVGGDRIPIRNLMVHRIEEYARHCGHADLLRECVDGRVGQ
ncbi:DinB family protein [Microbacteriaceae bacterium VKM Ac-2855]|nr:DinB family protein [Microbacteriaceae bacterium VKM Ac-2855]